MRMNVLHQQCFSSYDEITRLPVFATDEHKVEEITALFDKNPESAVIVISKNQQIKGVIVRAHLYRQLGKPFGNDLFLKRPVNVLMDRDYLIIDESEQMHSVVKKAMSRKEENLYDPILVNTSCGIRTLSVRALLLKINSFQKDSMLGQAEQLTNTVEYAQELNSSFQEVGEQLSKHVDHFAQLIKIADDSKEKFILMNNIFAGVTEVSNMQSEASKILEQQSEQLLKYVDNILQLAKQTNILSLNASVESARAGAHGLGFAVVAEEVRKLAGNTTHISEEIKEQISTIFQMIKENSQTTITGLKEVESAKNVMLTVQESFSKLAGEINTSNLEMERVNINSQYASEQAQDLSKVLQELYEKTHSNAMSLATDD